MIEKWQVRNSASSSFYRIGLLSVDSVNAYLMADSVLSLYCIWVNSPYCWWLGRRVLSLRAPEFEWTASASPTLSWCHKVARSIDRPPSPLHFIPPSSPKGRGAILCFVRWVPNIFISANHLGYFKEAVGRNLPRAAARPELNKLEISKFP